MGEIFVDEYAFPTIEPSIIGAGIKGFVCKGHDYQLFLEIPGNQDRLILDMEAVAIENGMRFYTVPLASF